MFYFKNQKRELRQPIINVFQSLNKDAIFIDNFISTSKREDSKIKMIRLHTNIDIVVPQFFVHVEDDPITSKSRYYYLQREKTSKEVKNIDGIFYEFITVEVSLLKEFNSKKEYLITKSYVLEEHKQKHLLTLDEHIMDQTFVNHGFNVDITDIIAVSKTLFYQMEFFIEKSTSFRNKKLAS